MGDDEGAARLAGERSDELHGLHLRLVVVLAAVQVHEVVDHDDGRIAVVQLHLSLQFSLQGREGDGATERERDRDAVKHALVALPVRPIQAGLDDLQLLAGLHPNETRGGLEGRHVAAHVEGGEIHLPHPEQDEARLLGAGAAGDHDDLPLARSAAPVIEGLQLRHHREWGGRPCALVEASGGCEHYTSAAARKAATQPLREMGPGSECRGSPMASQ